MHALINLREMTLLKADELPPSSLPIILRKLSISSYKRGKIWYEIADCIEKTDFAKK